ncbi:cytochrome c-type biogenesis protein CcmH [Rhizobium sp. RU35A]|nr:cytochrome c-type biogenesis protein CcmH [Rhizobium sp. RU35A]
MITPPRDLRFCMGLFSVGGRGGSGPAEGRGLRLARIVLGLVLLLAPMPAFAVNPDEVLKDPVLEERARALSGQLRCMVCQNQSIDDSNAELAKDLRLLVRERIVRGDSDSQVIDYVVSRYGEFVLLKPRLSARTVLLWCMPAVLLAAGALALVLTMRRRRATVTEQPLTEAEKARLDALLGE